MSRPRPRLVLILASLLVGAAGVATLIAQVPIEYGEVTARGTTWELEIKQLDAEVVRRYCVAYEKTALVGEAFADDQSLWHAEEEPHSMTITVRLTGTVTDLSPGARLRPKHFMSHPETRMVLVTSTSHVQDNIQFGEQPDFDEFVRILKLTTPVDSGSPEGRTKLIPSANAMTFVFELPDGALSPPAVCK